MSYCRCKKCTSYIPPKIDRGLECKICGEKFNFNFAWLPDTVCDECWEAIPYYIPDEQMCKFIIFKIKNLESGG